MTLTLLCVMAVGDLQRELAPPDRSFESGQRICWESDTSATDLNPSERDSQSTSVYEWTVGPVSGNKWSRQAWWKDDCTSNN